MKTFNDERNGEESENEDRGGTTQRRRQRWRWRKKRKIVIISLGLTRWRRGKMHCDITRNRREALRYNRCMRLNRLFPPRIIVAVFEFLSSHSLSFPSSLSRALSTGPVFARVLRLAIYRRFLVATPSLLLSSLRFVIFLDLVCAVYLGDARST